MNIADALILASGIVVFLGIVVAAIAYVGDCRAFCRPIENDPAPRERPGS